MRVLTVANSSTASFGNIGFSNLIGFDVETEDVGTYTSIDCDFTLNSTNISNFGLANAFTRIDGNKAYFDTGSLRVTIVVPEPSAAFLGTIGCFLLVQSQTPALALPHGSRPPGTNQPPWVKLIFGLRASPLAFPSNETTSTRIRRWRPGNSIRV